MTRQPTKKIHTIITIFILAILIWSSWKPTLRYEFVSDDVSIANAVQTPVVLTMRSVLYHPVHSFIQRGVYHTCGIHPECYRVVNITFHTLMTITVYAILATLHSFSLALCASLLFAVHPIVTESITWISGGIYAQYSFFFLLSLFLYFRSKHNTFMYGVSIILFGIALGVSEKAFILSFIFPIYEWCYGSIRTNWKKIIPYGVISFLWAIIFFYQGTVIQDRLSFLASGVNKHLDVYNPLIQIPIAISTYIQLLFFPLSLSFYHSTPYITPGEFTLRCIVTLLFFGLLVYTARTARSVFFWLSVFIISLLPVLTPLKIAWVVAERYVYLGSAALISATMIAINTVWKNRWNSYVVLPLYGIIFLVLLTRTIIRNNDWKNADILWIATGKTAPLDPKTHNNLGDYYGRHGNMEKAIEEFKRAIELNPNYADAYHNAGNTYRQLGDISSARTYYEKALNINPLLWQTYVALAELEVNEKDLDLALSYIQKGITTNPMIPELYIAQGEIFQRLNNKQKARESLQQAALLNPNNSNIRALIKKLQTE